MDDPIAYLENENLLDLIEIKTLDNNGRGVFDAVRTTEEPVPPEADDLARLHKKVRERKSFTILEFGVGYSTIIMADALEKNREEWKKLDDPPEIRNRYMFELFCVDASEKWLDYWKETIPSTFLDRIHFNYSPVKIDEYNGRICHTYTNIPDIVPDFIYLDAPHPKQVEGDLYGLSFKCDERTVMAADLIYMEPTLLPGTYIIVDGRTNNARFLQRHFQRKFKITEDQEADVTTFELVEDRLGKYNILGTDYLD